MFSPARNSQLVTRCDTARTFTEPHPECLGCARSSSIRTGARRRTGSSRSRDTCAPGRTWVDETSDRNDHSIDVVWYAMLNDCLRGRQGASPSPSARLENGLCGLGVGKARKAERPQDQKRDSRYEAERGGAVEGLSDGAEGDADVGYRVERAMRERTGPYTARPLPE